MISSWQEIKSLAPLKKIGLFANALILLSLLVHSVYRDIILEKQFPTDLRNRVVGARLQKDGMLPYHYHWRPADGLRFYNPDEDAWLTNSRTTADRNTTDSDINKITATPFFHELLFPICDLPQRSISRIWLWTQYLMLAAMIGMTCSLTGNRSRQWLILNIGILFTTTEAWKYSIGAGQLYFFESYLVCCILVALLKNRKYTMILAGIFAVVLVLTRPFAIVLFIPFLFYFKRYLSFLVTSFAGLATYLLFAIFSPGENALYKDYFSAMKAQVRMHQAATGTLPVHAAPVEYFTKVEGFDLDEVNRIYREHPIQVYTENGNVFVLYYKIFHKKIPSETLYLTLIATLTLLTILFYFRKKHSPPNLSELLLFGFTLYMIVELFSPVYRRQYNTVQWFPLVLLALLLLPERKNILFALFMAGLGLNIFNFSWLSMRHTLGEYIWLIALLLLIFFPQKKSAQMNVPDIKDGSSKGNYEITNG
jgi:hypothetical protein